MLIESSLIAGVGFYQAMRLWLYQLLAAVITLALSTTLVNCFALARTRMAKLEMAAMVSDSCNLG